MSITVSNVCFSHPGEALLFSNVSFKLGDREHAVLVGENGAGKSTLMRILAGELPVEQGGVQLSGDALYLRQDAGFASELTVRELLAQFAPPHLRTASNRLIAAERRLEAGDANAGVEVGLAIAHWSECGGYELEGKWDASVQRAVGTTLMDIATRPVRLLSGGERKRLAIDIMLSSSASVLLLDEPDNYLDVRAKMWLEDLIQKSRKTILSISHDREYLCNTSDKVLALEGDGLWVHGGSYATYNEAREARQASLKHGVAQWHEEERRLFQSMKVMKQRAMVNAKNASRAKAAETRWKRFAEAGPPPPPATSRPMKVRLTAAESAKRALVIDALGLDGLILPFSDVVRCGERLGLVGPNGTGKTHLLQMLAGLRAGSSGRIVLGPRVSVGIVTQVNERPAFTGQTVVHLVQDRVGNYENAMRVLARYGLERASTQNFETLSGGQKARLEVLALEVEGHNLLLLDEPTENLDVASSEALELALASFDGTCISVSHDRSFLKAQDRYWVLNESGVVHSILGYNDVLDALLSGTMSNNARPLTIEADAHRARRP